jgi:hypothetical protein
VTAGEYVVAVPAFNEIVHLLQALNERSLTFRDPWRHAVAMTIESVPESITRADYVSLIAAAGVKPEDTVSLEFRTDGIYAVVFAKDESGNRVVDPADGFCKHTVFIPVTDD